MPSNQESELERSVSEKQIARAAQRKAARSLTTDTMSLIRLGFDHHHDADEWNAAERLVATNGAVAYLVLLGITHRALDALASEWDVKPEVALDRLR
jgi:hypothetical protein